MASFEAVNQDSPAGYQQSNAGRSPLDSGTPMHDVFPAMDARFILIEVGKLTTKVDRLVEDVGKVSSKVDTLRGHVSFVKGAAWVLGALIVFGGSLVGLIASGKMTIGFH